MTTQNPCRFITIHMVQNHVPANLNRDDLGAPKVAYFGGVLRARISSQCLKRSIRSSEIFAPLCGGIRTRRLVEVIAQGNPKWEETVKDQLTKLGIMSGKNKTKGNTAESDEESRPAGSRLLIYVPVDTIHKLRDALKTGGSTSFHELLAKELSGCPFAPDVALFGRMLEAQGLSGTRVEAACQVAHALSTHEFIPEIDYFTAVDDVPGDDAGAAYLDEAGFASACFYKFFSIDRDQLVHNLEKAENRPPTPDPKKLAAHAIVRFLEAAAKVVPSGKRNAYAPFDLPAAIIVEFRDFPLNYANAFARPVPRDSHNLVGESVARLLAFAQGCDKGFQRPCKRFLWLFSGPATEDINLPENTDAPQAESGETVRVDSFENLLEEVAETLGYSLKDLADAVLPTDQRLDHLLEEYKATRVAQKPDLPE